MTTSELLSKTIRPPAGWTTEAKDTEWSTWAQDGKRFIAFQGSLSLTDWIYNFMAWSAAGTHCGITKKWKATQPAFDRMMNADSHEVVIFTGHSQGAAVALLAYLHTRKKYPARVASAVLFGCPKIMTLWKYFQNKSYEKNVNSIRIKSDIVTFLSPVNIAFGGQTRIGEAKPIWRWRKEDHYPKAYKKYL